MGAVEWGTVVPTVEIVARATSVRPLWAFEASTPFGLSAARWRLERLAPIGGRLPLGMLAYRAAGSAWATRRSTAGRSASAREWDRSRLRPATGARPGRSRAVRGRARLSASGDDPGRRQQLDVPGVAEIDDFFGVEDPWLAGYFQMLTSEARVLKPLDRKVDPSCSTRASTCSPAPAALVPARRRPEPRAPPSSRGRTRSGRR
jgi:hypothetical protein